MRYKLTIEYDGTNYLGWQSQENGKTVQEAIEQAIFKFSGEKVNLCCAGRTDAGVHACGQVAHFDLPSDKFDAYTVRNALNFYLKKEDVVVLNAEVVGEDFHARFTAKKRYYKFVILNRHMQPVLEKNRVWWVGPHLDEQKMNDAAKLLLGKHDFSTFRAAECQAKSPVKTLDEAYFVREGEHIYFYTSATSFLHHQVRNMVGALKLVGEGKWSIADFKKAFDACDRTKGGPNASPSGLYFMRVEY